jgi:hypothetical protein
LNFPTAGSFSIAVHISDGTTTVNGTIAVLVAAPFSNVIDFAAEVADGHDADDCTSTRGMNDVGEVTCALPVGHPGPHMVRIRQAARDGPGEVRGWYDDSPRV